MEACRLPSDDRDISKDAINVLVKQVTFSSRFPGMFSAEDKRPVERSNTGYFIRLPLASWGTVQTTYLWPRQLVFLLLGKQAWPQPSHTPSVYQGGELRFDLATGPCRVTATAATVQMKKAGQRAQTKGQAWASFPHMAKHVVSPECQAYRGTGKMTGGGEAMFVHFNSSPGRHIPANRPHIPLILNFS